MIKAQISVVLASIVCWMVSDALKATDFLHPVDLFNSLVHPQKRLSHRHQESHALRMNDPGDVAWVVPMTKSYTEWEKDLNLIPVVEKRLTELTKELDKITGQDSTSPEGKKHAERRKKITKMEENIDTVETISEDLKRVTERIETVTGERKSVRCENGVANSGVLRESVNITQDISFKEAFKIKPHIMAAVNLAGYWDPDQDPAVPLGPIDFFVRKSNINPKGFSLTFLSSTNHKDNSLIFVNWMACGL